MSAMEISCNYGVYEKRFENVFNKFNTNLASSIDIGASFAVYSNGKLLVDLAGGFKNKDKTEPDSWTTPKHEPHQNFQKTSQRHR